MADIYQSIELWQVNLVDPDNRRPVDYVLRCRLLAEVQTMQADLGTEAQPETGWAMSLGDLTDALAAGRIKRYLIGCAIQLRRPWTMTQTRRQSKAPDEKS